MKELRCIIIFILTVSGSFAQDVKKYAGKDFIFHVHNSIKKYAGEDQNEIYGGYFLSVDSIVVIERKNQEQIQTIIPDENSYSVINDTANDPLSVEDMNFDGYDDIGIVQFVPAAPNIPYFIWLYNPLKKVFERNYDLEKITSPEFDHKNKIIVSNWRGSAASYGTDTYKYFNGKWVLVKQITESPDEYDDMYKIILTKKLINGKMKNVSRVRAKW